MVLHTRLSLSGENLAEESIVRKQAKARKSEIMDWLLAIDTEVT